MTDIHIVCDYPHPPAKVWSAVTDPELDPAVDRDRARRPAEGFAPIPGTRFQFVAKPYPGWRGIVDCEVLEVREPSLLRFSWKGEENGTPTYVTYRIEPHGGGTRFTFDHTGFTGARRVLHGQAARLGPQEDAHHRPAGRPGRPRRHRCAAHLQHPPRQAGDLTATGGPASGNGCP